MRILITAAWASVRAGLAAMLAGAGDCEIVGEANGSAELARLLIEAAPDVVVCDVTPSEGAEIMDALAGEGAALVLLGADGGEIRLLLGAELSGWAYLRKQADRIELLGAIRAAAAGLIAVDPHFARVSGGVFLPNSEADFPPNETLTNREREVLQQMAQGLPNKQIAARLHISQHTVKFHVAAILAKLSVSSRTEAVTTGARRGLVAL